MNAAIRLDLVLVAVVLAAWAPPPPWGSFERSRIDSTAMSDLGTHAQVAPEAASPGEFDRRDRPSGPRATEYEPDDIEAEEIEDDDAEPRAGGRPAFAASLARSDCMMGGWSSQGFRNQGQCVRYSMTGKDSR